LAVDSKVPHDDTIWLTYWVIYSLLGLLEYIGYTFFHTLTFYWLGKSIFLIWLMMPGSTGGSQILYHQLIRPFIVNRQPSVDQSFPEGNVYIYLFIHQVTSYIYFFLQPIIIQIYTRPVATNKVILSTKMDNFKMFCFVCIFFLLFRTSFFFIDSTQEKKNH